MLRVTRRIQVVHRAAFRMDAERYLRFMLLGFALSIILTRLYLELTGYPQLGGGELHIAHMLWGGLLLFMAALLPLILANRSAYTTAAILGGVGIGLFIDEVGKFITKSNDYFYPAAAPIIYGFFLLTVLLYLQVRRSRHGDARSELYASLDLLQEVLDHDLELHEQERLELRLTQVMRQSERPDLAQLAQILLGYLQSDALRLIEKEPPLWKRWQSRFAAWEKRWIGQRLFRGALIVGLLTASILNLLDLIEVLSGVLTAIQSQRELASVFVAMETIESANDLPLFLFGAALEALVYLPLLMAALLLLTKRERAALGLAYLTLLFSLTTVDVLWFYFNQFLAVIDTLIEFCLLLGVLRYRRYYVMPAAREGA